MGFSQLFCSPNHGSDVMVRAFVWHSVELCSIPLSIHANDLKTVFVDFLLGTQQ